MLSILRQRNFLLLWSGQLISSIGNWVILVSLPFYVYELTGSALATGTMFIAQTLPRVILGSLISTFVDRWNPRRTMIVSDLSRSLILLPLLFVHSRESLWLVYVVAFTEMLVSLFFDPAKGVIIPRLVDKEELMSANSLDALSTGITTVIGPSLGGILIGLLGLTSVVVLDSLSYLISGLLICFISSTSQSSSLIKEPIKTTILKEWLSGLLMVRKEMVVSIVFIVTAIAMLGQGIISALLVIFASKILKGNSLEYGWLLASNGMGSLIGGGVLGQIGKHFQPIRLMGLGLIVVGAAVLLMVHLPILALALVLMALAGFAAMGYVISAQTLLQSCIEDDYRGRIIGLYYNIVSLMLLISMSLASTLENFFGIIVMFSISGGFFLFAGAIGIISSFYPFAIALSLDNEHYKRKL